MDRHVLGAASRLAMSIHEATSARWATGCMLVSGRRARHFDDASADGLGHGPVRCGAFPRGKRRAGAVSLPHRARIAHRRHAGMWRIFLGRKKTLQRRFRPGLTFAIQAVNSSSSSAPGIFSVFLQALDLLARASRTPGVLASSSLAWRGKECPESTFRNSMLPHLLQLGRGWNPSCSDLDWTWRRGRPGGVFKKRQNSP